MSWDKDRARRLKARAAREEYDTLRRSAAPNNKSLVHRRTKSEVRSEADTLTAEFRQSVSENSLQLGQSVAGIPPWEDQQGAPTPIDDAPPLAMAAVVSSAEVGAHAGKPRARNAKNDSKALTIKFSGSLDQLVAVMKIVSPGGEWTAKHHLNEYQTLRGPKARCYSNGTVHVQGSLYPAQQFFKRLKKALGV